MDLVNEPFLLIFISDREKKDVPDVLCIIVLKSAAKIRPFFELTMKKVWKNADSQKTI